MVKLIRIIACLLLAAPSYAQTVHQKLQNAFQVFERDPQLKHAISSLHVIHAKTGKVVFSRNSHVGLAPASTQKIITSVTAYELLGRDYRYNTGFAIVDDNGRLGLTILPSGDPTLGSWRWESTREDNVLGRIAAALRSVSPREIEDIRVRSAGWEGEPVPDGWIWQDLGNYYGAGARVFNWRENQYDILLQSGSRIGDPVKIVGTRPRLHSLHLVSEARSAAKGSGDNAYIYLPAYREHGIVRGTIPVNENRFEISGAMTDPAGLFVASLVDTLKTQFNIRGKTTVTGYEEPAKGKITVFHTETSPVLDSMIYWFNKKSINLYGEALVKTMGFDKRGVGATDTGVMVIRDFWKQKGLGEAELNISDGSGLSPQNRVTTRALAEILKYARGRSWFPGFYHSLPDYNGMRMKSGTIRDVKGFCGYHKAKDGSEYIFSFLVNNYNGLASGLVNKMYRVLDVLK